MLKKFSFQHLKKCNKIGKENMHTDVSAWRVKEQGIYIIKCTVAVISLINDLNTEQYILLYLPYFLLYLVWKEHTKHVWRVDNFLPSMFLLTTYSQVSYVQLWRLKIFEIYKRTLYVIINIIILGEESQSQIIHVTWRCLKPIANSLTAIGGLS